MITWGPTGGRPPDANGLLTRLSLWDGGPCALDGVAELLPGSDAAAGDVDDVFESLSLEDRRGQAASLAALADRRDGAVSWKLVQPPGQLAVGDVQLAGDVAGR